MQDWKSCALLYEENEYEHAVLEAYNQLRPTMANNK